MRAWTALGVIAGALLALRVGIAARLELFPDEFLYAWIGRHAPLSFCPHPPGVPLFVRAGTALLGNTELGARLASLLLSTLTFLPVFLLARSLGGARLALLSTLAVACVPEYVGFGAIATPDAPQLFFWSCALFFTWNALQSSRLVWWLLAGASMGAGLYVKYILVLYYPALVLCLLLVPEWRRHWRSGGLYLSVALAFVLFVPFGAWCEAQAGWGALRYHLSDRQEFIFPSPGNILAYQAVHAGYLSPLLYGAALWAMVWTGRRAFARGCPRLVFLFSFSALPYLFFALIAAVTRRELSREQWDAPAYIAALIAAALMLQTALQEAPSEQIRRRWRRGAAASLAVAAAMSALFLLEGLSGSVSRLLGEAPLFSSTLGWRELARGVDRELATLGHGERPVVLLGDSFRGVMAYDFYGRQELRLCTLDHSSHERYGLEELLASNGLSQQTLGQCLGQNALFICDPNRGTKPSGSSKRREEKLRRLFRAVEEAAPVHVERLGRVAKNFRLFRCRELRQLP